MFKLRKCALCGKSIDHFLKMDDAYEMEATRLGYHIKGKLETLNKKEYSCPECYGVDRDRLYALFFQKLIFNRGDSLFRNLRLLNIAPSVPLQRYIDINLGEIQCDSMDLFMDGVDYQADIQDMTQIKDAMYDMWICSHVLEHVQDDRKALKELFRILKPSGIGLLLVPLDLGQKAIEEAWGLSEEENIARFGQKDHVRKYSKEGFLSRIREAGFYVKELNKKYFTKKNYKENAINNEAVLYCCSKRPCEDPAEEFVHSACMVKGQADFFLSQYPINCEVNYYFDKIICKNNYLYIWGWFYFINENSRKTKAKLLLINSQRNIKMVTILLRRREDIDNAFNEKKDKKYLSAGIEAEMEDTFLDGECRIYLLAENGEKTAAVEMRCQ